MKFYSHGKFRVLLSGPEKYLPDVMEALERGGCNIFAKIDMVVMREKLVEKGVPENLIEEHLKNMRLDDETFASTRKPF